MMFVPETPRILFVTPEVSYLPRGMSAISHSLKARAGELADVSAALITALDAMGADVHVALPDYRSLFNHHSSPLFQKQLTKIRTKGSKTRVHLAEDRIFYYKKRIYSDSNQENLQVSLSFQREVINTIVPRVQPDLIHCNDWMTGLIPAMARRLSIPCLFTVHKPYNVKTLLSSIEDRGIDAALFWQNLFFDHPPANYEETRSSNPVDFLASGIFAAHFVNTTGSAFLSKIIHGHPQPIDLRIQTELLNKAEKGCAAEIVPSLAASVSPETDTMLFKNYDGKSHETGKKANKLFFQEKLGLHKDPQAPVFFWPSWRGQQEIHWIAEVVQGMISQDRHQNLEMVFAAQGPSKREIEKMIQGFNLKGRAAVFEGDDSLSRLAFGASDYMVAPPAGEPGDHLPITGLLYGTLPIAHNTGVPQGIITPLEGEHNRGNGFLFHQFHADSILPVMANAMAFYHGSQTLKSRQIFRIMKQSRELLRHWVTAAPYVLLYGKMLERPFIN